MRYSSVARLCALLVFVGAASIVGVLALTSGSALAVPIEYDLSADWSDVQNPFGAWTLKKSATAIFTLNQADYFSNGENQRAWADGRYHDADADIGHVPFWEKATASLNYPANRPELAMGDVMMHGAELDRTGSNVTSAVWTASQSGLVLISGAVWSPGQLGRDMSWELRANGSVISGGPITSNGTYTRSAPFYFAAGTGGSSVLCRSVVPGDEIELAFVSQSSGGNLGDAVCVNFHVSLEPSVQAEVLFADDFEDGPDPTWVQPNGGWVCENGQMRNTTTCGLQSCMPDIWGGGPQYSDYLVSFDLKLSAGNLQLYVMADQPAEHEQGQTGGYAVDVGVGDGNCGGYLNRILPWPNVQRLATQAGSAFCFDQDTVYRVKCGRIGSQVLYKAWPKTASEPAAWQLQVADDTHHSGYWGISFWNGMGWVDNFVIEGPGGVPIEGASCLKFDGLDDGAHAAATDLPTGANDRTLEFWIKSDNFQQYAFIAGWGSFDATNRSSAIRVGRFEANRRLFFWVYGVDDLVSTTDLQDGMWYHVALTFRDNMASLYLNGELDCEGLRPGLDTPAGTEFWLANCPVWPGAFAGAIDEVRVWNRALSPEEIRAKMNSHLVAGAEAGLVLYWPMNEGMGGFVHDFSRRGNYGKVIGAQWSSGVSFQAIDVVDVPGDQGGALRLSWPAFPADVIGASNAITEYEVQRFGSGTWAAIATVPATQAVSYQTVVQTSDVLTVGQVAPYASYRVAAHTSSADETYYSIVKSAYSIDNVPPPKPVAVLVDDLNYRYVTWTNPEIPDLATACVYRGASAGFTPDVPVECPGVFYNELDLDWYFYRVQFTDIHGNVSEFSDELHGQWPTPVPGAVPAALRLYPCQPNPFNPRTTIKFDLPVAGTVRLAVFDLAGRLMRTLVGEDMSPGSHEVLWDGRDVAGREVGSGTYLARLEFNGKVQTIRMGLVR